jgi:U3 small nucleolar RNA-associated protein 19
MDILKSIESVPEEEAELEDFYVAAPENTNHDLYSLNKHKKRAQAAWLALMNREMSKDQRKVILGIMSESIAPWFMKPELLMDFLTDSYNTGGSTSLLALSGLFYLIQERNLDYPSFYQKLYSLLDRDILHSLHRSRFLRLLDNFLSSTHLPAVLVASFIKRLARLTLNASPSGIAPVIPWIYNILKKHPSCTFMIHRVPRTHEQIVMLESEGMTDPFLMEEADPMSTNAIDSCLWEIVTLQSHYHPNLATLAKIISEQFTKNAYNLEDFLDHSYDSVSAQLLFQEIR